MRKNEMSTLPLPILRLRRLRQSNVLRELVKETQVTVKDLIYPLFIKGDVGEKVALKTMPGQFQIPISQLKKEVKELERLGIRSVLLFGIPPSKDPMGRDSYSDDGIVQKAIRTIKECEKDLLVITDLCFCEYTDHGHCGILNERGRVDNDKTLELLLKQALSHAKAGADILAPSGMMDGTVKALRFGLDREGFSDIPLFNYSVKYCSCFYGPFRDAAEGAPSFGDRSDHQLPVTNVKEALREIDLDVYEGADMLMVKPAHTYLDVIYRVKQAYPHIPLGAYHTSGEYAMIKAAASLGMLDEKKAFHEVLHAIKRAGADFIITYYAKEFANQ